MLLISLFTALSLFLSFWGVNAGLPSNETAALIFPDRSVLRDLGGVLKSTREEVYSDYRKQTGIELLKTYEPDDDTVTAVVSGRPASIQKKKLHSMRSGLLQSRFPDEQKSIMALSNIKPAVFDFNPNIFQYGGLYFYSVGAALKASELAGIAKITSDVEYYFNNQDKAAMLYIVPKCLGGILAAAAVPLIYILGGLISGKRAGIFAAFMLAALPSVAAESHSFKPYSFFLPFMTASLIFSFKACSRPGRLNFFLSGVFAGLSAGALIISGTALISSIAAYFFSLKKNDKNPAGILFIFAGFAAAFIAVNPYWLLSFSEVKNEFSHLTRQAPFIFSPARMFHHFFFELHKITGWGVYMLFAGGLLLALKKRSAKDWILLSGLLPFYIYTANTHWASPHYAMPLIPFAVLLAARFALWLGDTVKWKPIYLSLLVFVGFYTIGNSVYYDLLLTKDKHLLEAGSWINKNIPRNAELGASIYPLFGYQGYPPFNVLSYNINQSRDPEYFISLGKDDPFISGGRSAVENYSPLVKFSRKKTFLDKLYSNHLFYYWDLDVTVYSKNKSAGSKKG